MSRRSTHLHPRIARQPARSLGLETLEDRCVPTVLLQDNFNDNSLDPAKWHIVLPDIPGPPSVVEQNQRLELRNRGHLVTQNEYDPAVVGPLTITGTWTFSLPQTAFQQEDYFQVYTRTDAAVDGPPYGDSRNGVGFNLIMHQNNPGQMWINYRVFPGQFANLANTPIMIRNHDSFRFTITDTGSTVSFAVQQLTGGNASAQITANVPIHFDTNRVDFHNAQFSIVNKVSYLDDVTIEGTAPTDLVAESFALNPVLGGPAFTYSITDAPLPQPATAEVYFASGPNWDDRIGDPVFQTPLESQQGTYGPIVVPRMSLPPIPSGATHLLLALDPANQIAESEESNNTLALPLFGPRRMGAPNAGSPNPSPKPGAIAHPTASAAAQLRDSRSTITIAAPTEWAAPSKPLRSVELPAAPPADPFELHGVALAE